MKEMTLDNIITDTQSAKAFFFEGKLLESVKSAPTMTKAERIGLKRKIRENFRLSNVEAGEYIKGEVKKRKERYAQDCTSLNDDLQNTLSSIERNFIEKGEDDEKAKKDRKNVVSGEKTKAQRAYIKLTKDYERDLSLIKGQKTVLYEAETELIKDITGKKFTPLRDMATSGKNFKANFNLKKSVTDKHVWLNLLPFLMLIVIIICHAIACAVTGYKFNWDTIITYGIYVAVVAIGGVFIYSQGAFDMSLGPASMMCAAIAGLSFMSSGNIVVSCLCAIILGVALGLINAFLANCLKLPVMVMTLTMMNILSSIFATISENQSLGYISIMEMIGYNSSALKWVTLVIFAVLCFVLFNYTKIGRRNKLIGSNAICAKFSGISIMKAGLISFAISGIGLGLCGFLFMTQNGYIDSNAVLSTVGLNVIIAISIGGMPTSGGPRSRISAAILGAFFLIFLEQFFAAIGLENYQYFAKGVIFLIVAFINFYGMRTKRLAQ